MESEEKPETGAVRVRPGMPVEYFDGEAWRPYVELPDPGTGPVEVFRLDGETEGTEER
ncbi:hypothetical protein ABZX85_15295 [Streptomyces sp. NPDC004539]|uniref:hypothetical protein n=1 Tax=Streptomyces sp. NPDC004539 TaxID=3154280 RepID=UPI0033B464BB